MFPFRVHCVGCDKGLVKRLQGELESQSAPLDGAYADVDAALAAVGDGAESYLLLFHLKSKEDLFSLKRLRESTIGHPILALVETAGGLSLLTDANRAGATQVVPLPLQAEDFAEALKCVVAEFGRPDSDSQTIAVKSVTGGCGATTIAINVAYEIARSRKLNCILIELMVNRGVVANYLDLKPRYTIGDLFSESNGVDAKEVQQALTRVTDHFQVLPGPCRATLPQVVDTARASRIVQIAQQLADVVILDIPSGYDPFCFDMMALAHHVVLVAEPLVPSIRSLKLLSDLLSQWESTRGQTLLVNRYDPTLPGFSASALKKLLHVDHITTIAEDAASVRAAVNHGRPLREESPHSRALANLNDLAGALLDRKEDYRVPRKEDHSRSPARAGLWSTLMGTFGLDIHAHAA